MAMGKLENLVEGNVSEWIWEPFKKVGNCRSAFWALKLNLCSRLRNKNLRNLGSLTFLVFSETSWGLPQKTLKNSLAIKRMLNYNLIQIKKILERKLSALLPKKNFLAMENFLLSLEKLRNYKQKLKYFFAYFILLIWFFFYLIFSFTE